MSTPAEILLQESVLGRWPRRLLHIDTLTSYEWQPGNRYGSFIEPQYAAITYTWGRWRLKANQLKHVQAIAIAGAEWDIPRVDPLHFTVQELEAVIMCTKMSPPRGDSPIGSQQRVDFVWLDVACIDQRENSLAAASEVGRQADIFRGASYVYAWLSTLSIQRLNQFFKAQEDFDDPRPEAALDALQDLTSDPWFSSLWTLQEAFLRTDAVFLSRDAQSVQALSGSRYLFPEPDPACLTLRIAIYFVNALSLSNRDGRGWSPSTIQAYDQVVALGERTGLYAISIRNPIATFLLAKYRKAERKTDMIYGIQQIFNHRLGKTAPGWNGQTYSLDELEEQFAKALLETHPVESQMHVFTQAAKFGSAWCLNASSVLRKMNTPYFPWIEKRDMIGEDRLGTVRPTCKLWAEKEDGLLWGRFKGKACDFSFWKHICDKVDNELLGLYTNLPILTVFLDVTEEFTDWPEHGAATNTLYAQRALINRLSNEFPSDTLKVLELGTRYQSDVDEDSDPDRFNPLTHGLLLLPKERNGIRYYHRVGFCTWYNGSILQREQVELAHEWQELNGKFG